MREGDELRVVSFLSTNRYAALGYLALAIALVFTVVLAFGASGAKPLNGAQSALLALISAIFQAGGAFAFSRQDARNRAVEERATTEQRLRAEAAALRERRVLEEQITSMPSEQAVAIALRRLIYLGNSIAAARSVAEKAHDETNTKEKQRAIGRLSANLSYVEEQVAESVEDWATMYPSVIRNTKEQVGD